MLARFRNINQTCCVMCAAEKGVAVGKGWQSCGSKGTWAEPRRRAENDHSKTRQRLTGCRPRVPIKYKAVGFRPLKKWLGSEK